ncbi:hypothetical protein KR018_001651 [Drosophila ironensis]|nr:hypothetical protein KR018_001651 [Drosophila ironensis]
MDKYIVFICITIVFVVIFLVGYFLASKFEETSVIRCCVILSCVCCYLAWLITFLMQMNPLLGPRGDRKVIFGILAYWPNSFLHDKPDK